MLRTTRSTAGDYDYGDEGSGASHWHGNDLPPTRRGLDEGAGGLEAECFGIRRSGVVARTRWRRWVCWHHGVPLKTCSATCGNARKQHERWGAVGIVPTVLMIGTGRFADI